MIGAHELRGQLALAEDHIHLNNAGVGPLTRAGQEAMHRMARLQSEQAFAAIEEIIDVYNGSRAAFGALVGAPAENVSMMQTCAAAISQVALGLDYECGQEIVFCDQEYPSNAYPWYEAARRHQLVPRLITSEADFDLDLEKVLSAIGNKTKVVALSWVQYQSGTCSDLKTIKSECDRVGAWLVVDAIQGLGVIPFPEDAVMPDAICGGTHKWLCGPLGHGFLIMDEEKRAQLSPLLHGAITYGTPEDLVEPGKAMRTDCGRFEPGNPLLWGGVAGAASINVLLKIGIPAIHERAMALSNQLMAGLQRCGGEFKGQTTAQRMSPIVSFSIPGKEMKECFQVLKEQKITGAYRAGGIRLAPHAFNTEAEIAKVVEIVQQWAQS